MRQTARFSPDWEAPRPDGEARRGFINASCSAAAARDPLDLGPHQPLDHAGEILVEPGLQKRPQNLARNVLGEFGTLQREAGREGVERGRNGLIGLVGKQRAASSSADAGSGFGALAGAVACRCGWLHTTFGVGGSAGGGSAARGGADSSLE